MNIVSDRDGFVWKGHDQLTPRGGTLSFAPGFQPNSLFQLHPPAAITALALHAEWGLVAAGTAHGLALFDYVRRKGVLTKCTLNPNGKLYKYVIVLETLISHVSSEVCIFKILQCGVVT
jgi:lethal(2) giant larvae protein